MSVSVSVSDLATKPLLPIVTPEELELFINEFTTPRKRLSVRAEISFNSAVKSLHLYKVPQLFAAPGMVTLVDRQSGEWRIHGLNASKLTTCIALAGASLLSQRNKLAGLISSFSAVVRVSGSPLANPDQIACQPAYMGRRITASGGSQDRCRLPSCPWCLADEVVWPAYCELTALMTDSQTKKSNEKYRLAIRRCDLLIPTLPHAEMIGVVNRVTREHKRRLSAASAIKQVRLISPINARNGGGFSITGENGYLVVLIDVIVLTGEAHKNRLSSKDSRSLETLETGLTETGSDMLGSPYSAYSLGYSPSKSVDEIRQHKYRMLNSPSYGLSEVIMSPNESQLRGLLPEVISVPTGWFEGTDAAVASLHLQLNIAKGNSIRFRRIATNTVKKLAAKSPPADEPQPVELTLTQPKPAEVKPPGLKSAYESTRLSLEQKWGLSVMQDFVRYLNASYKETDSASSSISRTPVELRNALHGDQRRTHGAESLQGSSGSGTSDHLCGVGSSGDGGGNTFCGVG